MTFRMRRGCEVELRPSGTQRTAASLIAAVLGCCLAGAATDARADPRPASPLVAVVPLRIEPHPFPGAMAGGDEAKLLQRLAAEATARAERTLLKQRLSGRVERRATAPEAGAAPVLTGVVRLPISLPPGQLGGKAMFRKGPFATAVVVLRQPDGTSVRREVTLDWGDVRWLRGVRIRRVRAIEEVLVDFVRKAVDHAVKRLGDADPAAPSISTINSTSGFACYSSTGDSSNRNDAWQVTVGRSSLLWRQRVKVSRAS